VKLSELELVPDLLRSLDSDREARGWDIPAELFTVTAEIITDQAAAVSVSEFPGWNQLMGGLGHCFHALTVANRIISGLPIEDRPTPDGLLGLVLVDEAWMVKPPPRCAEPDRVARGAPGPGRAAFRVAGGRRRLIPDDRPGARRGHHGRRDAVVQRPAGRGDVGARRDAPGAVTGG
jgi:hypothetical protein